MTTPARTRSVRYHAGTYVALVVAEGSTKAFSEPFFRTVTGAICTTLDAAGCRLVILTGNDRGRMVEYLLGQDIDGVALISMRDQDPLPGRLAAAGIPAVVCGRPPCEAVMSFVDADNVGGAYLAVEHLIQRGRRRIATIAGPADMAAGSDRLFGYRRALARYGLPEDPRLVVHGDFYPDSGERCMRQLLRLGPDVDAVFVASDLMAVGAVAAITGAGLRVPEDVAVVGFDDNEAALRCEPPLTTIRQPTAEAGRTMAELLLTRIRGDESEPRGIVLDTTLVVRVSS